jgi:hypothetical protein
MARAVVAQLDRATGYELVGWGFESLRPRFLLLVAAFAVFLGGCARGLAPIASELPASGSAAVQANGMKVFQPLATGDYWKYICNHAFTIVDRVVGTYHVKNHLVYALSLQIPSTPKKSVDVVQLVANDTKGNTWIYGYLERGKVHVVTTTEIVATHPVKNKHYDYPAPAHGKISRIFYGFEPTNRTPLGIFWVGAYFETNATHGYGYSLGRGVMEEDHGPHFQYDCLIEKYLLK